MQIRPARSADSKAIAQVHVDSWRTTYRDLLPDDFLANLSYERREQAWREVLASAESQHHCVYVAEDDSGRVVGFAHGGPERENDPVYKSELFAIYLLESYQHRGIGGQLVRSTAQHLLKSGFDSMLVWVLAGNPSRKFYERLGGQQVREKEITVGISTLIEVAYGWPDIRVLVETNAS